MLSLTLYISGDSANGRRARDNFGTLLRRLTDTCDAQIVDVLTDPYAAEEARVIATPMLVLTSSTPARRVIGDLSDLEGVLDYLELPASPPAAPQPDRPA